MSQAPTEATEDDDQTLRPSPVRRQAAAPGIAKHTANALAPGTRLLEFEILAVLGNGSFGVVYLASDTQLGRKVALKEYMPVGFAMRGEGATVAPLSEESAVTFAAGLRSFVNEAHLLAQFNHASLVRVHRFWEANGTAYMIMQHYEGKTLKATLAEMTGPPSEIWLRGLLTPILAALETMHAARCFHRDIAPDNILISESQPPVLLDFGATRRVIAGMQQTLTVILKPAYAPIEQYSNNKGQAQQGAWTDLYALAAVIYRAILGKPPQPAMERVISEQYQALTLAAEKAMPGRYGRDFLHAIDSALALAAEQRPQTVAAFSALLGPAAAAAPRVAPEPVAVPAPPPFTFTFTARAAASAPPASPASSPSKPKSKIFAITGGVGAVLTLTLTLELQFAQHTPGDLPPPPPPALAKPAFHPLRALDEIIQSRNREHVVTVQLEQEKLVIGRDAMRFRLRSSKPGFVYVLMLGSDQRHMNLLFPNPRDNHNRIAPDQELQLPRPTWNLRAQGPQGTNQFVVLVSDWPRDFGKAGIDGQGEFPLVEATALYAAFKGKEALFSGTPVCREGAACSNAYGAAGFSVDEVYPGPAASASE